MPLPLVGALIFSGPWFPPQGLWPTAASTTAAPAAARDRSAEAFGPITTRIGRVVSLPFLRFVPRSRILQSGERSLETSMQVVNDVRRFPKDVGQPSVLEEDQETQRLAFLYSHGLGRGLEASVEAPLIARDGGFMDPIIQWWHQTVLGPHERVRNHLPFGRSFVRIPGVGDFGSASGIGDLSFFLRKRLTPRLVASVAVKLPTGRAADLLGSGALDAGIDFEYRTMLGRQLRLDASAGVVAQGKPTVLKRARGLVDQESLTLTYLQNGRDAWIVQWQSEASPILTVPSANGAHRMLTFGYERRVSDRERLDLYFSEDQDLVPGAPLLVNIAPDFTIGIRWVRRL